MGRGLALQWKPIVGDQWSLPCALRPNADDACRFELAQSTDFCVVHHASLLQVAIDQPDRVSAAPFEDEPIELDQDEPCRATEPVAGELISLFMRNAGERALESRSALRCLGAIDRSG